ncbi:glucohydrolase [Alloscardovia macacae]|uniref:Glucohydrolase n=1 Tax=Alloscardovia macacae TaxID=1160091 RepID=A0A1Y2T3D2_9BIFI|nr:alpha-glucosidase [Alloscardovia macacae]OTA26048.1 glucohydrolase [Alloscardovia macacae]OTA29905.1 glucohydrolase [Alloscardovia macacae]
MTDFTRTHMKEAPSWWANAVVYQIYPRSFQDTNGDGMGDLPGITQRLPYLADLGVDVIWLSPVYKSPQDDNGYDISDYRDIDPMFGTLEDMDALLDDAHKLGMKVVMDLVVNHTSDEHNWFEKSKQNDPAYADWYMWADPKPGHEGGTEGAEPNAWGSYFGGSAWEWVPERGQYYFHQFSKKQPDLNWQNEDMRRAVYAMMNWWMDRGVDGFRMDVISLISKRYDEEGRLPGVPNSQLPMREAGPDGYVNPFADCSDGPRLDEFLQEMHHAVFDGRDGYLTVGEAPGISADRAAEVTALAPSAPQSRELDMLFLFDHVDINTYGPGGKWGVVEQPFKDVRPCLKKYESIVEKGGWTSLFFCNHDQPRSVSRWGDDSTDALRIRSAKALALVLHLHKGTPYIYQGEELGMTNADYTRLEQYEDLESINMYHQLVGAGVLTAEQMLAGIQRVGRDNARTPMQWDDTRYAGFESADAERAPWLEVNANKAFVNAAAQVNDPESVHAFYKKLISLRHTSELVALGDWSVLDESNPSVYAYVRSRGDERLLVLANMSGAPAAVPAEAAALLGGGFRNVLVANDAADDVRAQLSAGTLQAWTAAAVLL